MNSLFFHRQVNALVWGNVLKIRIEMYRRVKVITSGGRGWGSYRGKRSKLVTILYFDNLCYTFLFA